MKLRLMGLLLALLPMACWAWSLRDPCGVTGEAWRECRAHHQAPHAVDENAPAAGHGAQQPKPPHQQ